MDFMTGFLRELRLTSGALILRARVIQTSFAQACPSSIKSRSTALRRLQLLLCLSLGAASMAPTGHDSNAAQIAERAESRQAAAQTAKAEKDAARAARREERLATRSNRLPTSAAESTTK